MSASAPPARHWLLAEKRPPLPPAGRGHRPLRKGIHLACFFVFLLLPFTDLLRVDIPRQRCFIAGTEILISEFSILFFALMFLMFVVAAMAIVYGRIYCSYACPQMIFSEWSTSVEGWAARQAQRLAKAPSTRKILGKGIFLAILAVASVFLAFVFTAYFVEPRDLLHRLFHLDLVTVGGITGATVTLVTFLDFTLVRQKFCTTICPYGYIQGFLQDRQSLLVIYRDETNACIDCKKCVRVCEMGIDIRKGPYQIECVHCGDCVDACEDVLRKVGHPGLIHYSWGEGRPGGKEPFLKRAGFRDAKRYVILGVMVCYASALGFALKTRKAVLMRITPDRTTLFQVLPDGRVANRVRLNLANRSHKSVDVKVWVEGLPGARIGLASNPLPLAAGQTAEETFDLSVPKGTPAQELTPIRVVVQSSDQGAPEAADMMFIMPTGSK
jgi:cytochrome c oxidase accessory protein FixG